VQVGWSVWAPYHEAEPWPFHTSQQVPSDERAARVTVPPPPPLLAPPTDAPAPAASTPLMAAPTDPPAGALVPPPVAATLTVDALVVGPET
jgi:hypothetical protein